jgi:hypothetical protein
VSIFDIYYLACKSTNQNERNQNKANSENSPPGEGSQTIDEDRPKIDEEVRAYAVAILGENKNLQKLANQLQTENHNLKTQVLPILFL